MTIRLHPEAQPKGPSRLTGMPIPTSKLGDLGQRVSDEDALIAMITPVLGDIIRRRI